MKFEIQIPYLISILRSLWPLLLPNLIKTGKNGIPLKTIKRPKEGKPLPKMKDEI